MSIDFASTPGEITLQQVHQICDLSMLRMYQFTMTQTKTPYFVLLYWSFFTQLGWLEMQPYWDFTQSMSVQLITTSNINITICPGLDLLLL